MQLSRLLLCAASLTPLVAASPSCCKRDVNSQDHYKSVLDSYVKLWDGDLSAANRILDEDVVLYSDRFPSATGVGSDLLRATSREDFKGFVQRARTGWEKYTFEVLKWTGGDIGGNPELAIRWQMHGVLGANFTLIPTPLDPGSRVSYNGTEFMTVDKCTGLVKEITSAQDLISYFHELQLGQVTV